MKAITTINKPKKITMLTVKAFIRNNQGKIFINICRENNEFSPALPDIDPETSEHSLGIIGAHFVLGSRDYFTAYEDAKYQGFHVSNSCGSFILVIEKQSAKAQHTPGPWYLASTDKTIVVIDKSGQCAEVVGRDGIVNAKLIAQAPELLSALKLLTLNIKEHYTRGGKFSAPGQIEISYWNALNAIGRAEQD